MEAAELNVRKTYTLYTQIIIIHLVVRNDEIFDEFVRILRDVAVSLQM